MTSRERQWRDALLAAMIPATGAMPTISVLDLDDFWIRFRSLTPLTLRFAFRFAVMVLNLLPIVTKRRTFLRLSSDDRDQFLNRVLNSRLFVFRQLALVVKQVACFAYFQDPMVRRAMDRT
ncbi:MAG: hypothetical protein HN348_16995 [Proteobacteria bacterium]|jgi:hypothetical protein|nr:hypothetical protein [Pseudomonadota bacterium]